MKEEKTMTVTLFHEQVGHTVIEVPENATDEEILREQPEGTVIKTKQKFEE